MAYGGSGIDLEAKMRHVAFFGQEANQFAFVTTLKRVLIGVDPDCKIMSSPRRQFPKVNETAVW
jgi:ABC-type thiamine transport system ATPase subunit